MVSVRLYVVTVFLELEVDTPTLYAYGYECWFLKGHAHNPTHARAQATAYVNGSACRGRRVSFGAVGEPWPGFWRRPETAAGVLYGEGIETDW